MRYLILLTFLFPLFSFAVTGENIRFDFTSGQPTITDDTTNTCNNTTIAMFAFTNGQPTTVYDSTATCTTAGGTVTTPLRSIIWWDGVVLEESLIKPLV